MTIYDKNNNIVVIPDLSKGHLVPDKRFVKKHAAVPEVAEQSHIETVAEYPNGGKDIAVIVDIPYSPAKPEWDEYEDIFRYVEFTAEELEQLKKPSEMDVMRANIAYLAMMTGNMEGLQL